MSDKSFQAELRDSILGEYASGMAKIYAEFHDNHASRKAGVNRSVLIDNIIKETYAAGLAEFSDMPRISIMATGGYGRCEMFFCSDIDLMFLVEDGGKERAEPLISMILHLLWDLKLKLGHSVRYVGEAIDESLKDFTTRTNLLESRFVVGNSDMSADFIERFNKEAVQGRELEFIEAKLAERTARHIKFGDSQALLEPNIKEGKGGLRDLQTLMWLMRACYGAQKMAEIAELGKISAEELRDFRHARKFLHLVRLHLHDIAGRAEERLTFDFQRQIAERLGYRGEETANQSVERFMKRYFQVTRTVSQLTRTLCFMLEEEWGNAPLTGVKALWKSQQLPDGLIISSNRLHFKSDEAVNSHPELMIGIFWYLHHLDIAIHPAAWQFMTRNLQLIDADLRKNLVANDGFIKLVLDSKNPVPTLRKMNESGVLGKFIPDFGLLFGQMQFDLYHSYTVDEHILTALGYLHKIEAGEMADIVPLATSIFPDIKMRRVLYLALFCHDIAKGRGGDHHLKGVDIGWKLSIRFAFDRKEQEALAWLIEHHQDMSMVAFKRDMDEENTIYDFAAEVKTIELLNMLYVLTIADIHAVASNIWNSWKGNLLETLYHKTARHLSEYVDEVQDEVAIAEDLRKGLEDDMPQAIPAEIADYIISADSVSREAYDVQTHARIFPCWQAVKQGDRFGLRFKSYPEQNMTQVTIATPDRHGLFSQIAGVFAICGANIISARICTRDDNIIIDRFAIQDENGGAFYEDRRQERIRQRLKQVLSGDLHLEQAVDEAEARYPSNTEAFDMLPEVVFDNVASQSHTLVEVQCLDTRGLLYRVTNALTELGLSISTAHIATYGEKVVDVFYISDGSGNKLPVDKHAPISAKLMEVLS